MVLASFILSIFAVLISLFAAWNDWFEIRTKLINFYRNKLAVGNDAEKSQISKEVSLITRKAKLPPELNINSKKLEKRLNQFDGILHSIIKKFFSISSGEILNKPEILASIFKARNKYAEWGNKIDVDLLIFLLKKRIKSHDQGVEVLYSLALDKIDQVSKIQLKTLVLLQTQIGLLPFLHNSRSADLPKLEPLEKFIKEGQNFNIEDIDHLRSLGLIDLMFPYKWKSIEIKNNSKLKKIHELCNTKLKNIQNVNYQKLNLTPVGTIIATSKIKSLIRSENVGFLYQDKILDDLEINSLSAKGNIIAYSEGNAPPPPHV